jgi:hypothetical protein
MKWGDARGICWRAVAGVCLLVVGRLLYLMVRRIVRTRRARHAVEPLVWDDAARRQTRLVVWPLPPEARQLSPSAWFSNRSLRWR